MFRVTKTSKRGFTLLETMLAVALLLIVTLIAYEGFMTTLNYAGDTALADRVSNQNAGVVYQQVGAQANGGAGSPSASSGAVMVQGNGYVGVFQVGVVHSTSGMSVFSNGSEYTDDSSFINTTNRHGFYYAPRMCPVCHTHELEYYEEKDESGNTVIKAYCSDKHCSFEGKIYNK